MRRVFAENLCKAVVAQLTLRYPERTVTAAPWPRQHGRTTYVFVVVCPEGLDFQHVIDTFVGSVQITLDSVSLALSKRVWLHISSHTPDFTVVLTISPV